MVSNYLYLAAINLSGLNGLSSIFKYIIIGVIYVIIIFALRIMYKDMKNGDKKQMSSRTSKKTFGLEVIDSGMSKMLKNGSVIPINSEITIGRREENAVVIQEGYVSGHHARIFPKNNAYVLEDLGSTNGTILNGDRIQNKVYIRSGDEIKIGTTVFKVIG
ncbi:Forkhead associated (FHA) domain, binds pSer, pThr, pTyr [Clostridium acidisoli DSM 12555]|uniref:Forkhead associated (FHA) domain, binds pSer, pThr, pTyr n=1 Tax=Clostridium acidisoli DSM 12555 TaxID=1121291 RepID=A0A1W1XH39_9CLOT|nr:FHA domain-containing protein [Clostridium acidisoli]SMC23313.1 Forkhead associated (FHA) domain, binds pSer, pThr, pTyr [Clostridium acidisoli DSM 12555]